MTNRMNTCYGVMAIIVTLSGCGTRDNEPAPAQAPAAAAALPTNPFQSVDFTGDIDETTESVAEANTPPGTPLSSTPGGDTSAIAGLWNSSQELNGETDERYVLISEDGLFTDIDYRQDDFADDGNCYIRTGPLTLTLEDASSHLYSLPDGRTFNATIGSNAIVLYVTLDEILELQWSAVTGLSTEDLDECTL